MLDIFFLSGWNFVKDKEGMMEITKGTRVFITGAGSGIGRSTAIAAANLGARLFLTDINQSGLEQTVALLSGKNGEVCMVRAMDISQTDQVRQFAEDIHKKFVPMDVVMNIARIEDMTHGHWKKIIDVNLWGPIHILESFVPEMIRAKKGHIVNVSSVAGLMGAPWHAAYSASKSGLIGLSEALFFDLKLHHIGITVVCPGGVDTSLKNTVEILGMDKNSPQVQEAKERFSRHAISPDRVAIQILKAVRKNTFLVITSGDVKFLYFCKHHLPPLYRSVMFRISKMMNTLHTKNNDA
jgi:NAD(P)-dependent dehydrogenase (short-subunit alcohol dehydrogenase family)